ncbi:hypothetical protein D3C86_1940160 [compost metagenome]
MGEATVNIPASLAGFFIGSFVCQMVYVLGGGVVGKMFSRKAKFHRLNWLSGFLLIVFSVWKLCDFIKEKSLLWEMGWSMVAY